MRVGLAGAVLAERIGAALTESDRMAFIERRPVRVTDAR